VPERTYSVNYVSNAATERTHIAGLKTEYVRLAVAAKESQGALAGGLKVPPNAGGTLERIEGALKGIASSNHSVSQVAEAIVSIYEGSKLADGPLRQIVASLRLIGEQNIRIGNVAAAVHGLGVRTVEAAPGAVALDEALFGVTRHIADISETSAAVTGVQRHLYGAKMNAQDLGAALGNVKNSAQGIGAATANIGNAAANIGQGAPAINALAASAENAQKSVGGLRARVRRLAGSLKKSAIHAGGFVAAMAAMKAVGSVGDAFNEDRTRWDEGADAVIKLQEKYRQIASMKGKAAPDSADVMEGFQIRRASGMNEAEAKDYEQEFRNSVAAGVTKGNITPQVEKESLVEGAKMGVRLDAGAKTAGDFFGIMSNFGKVDSAEQARGIAQAALEQLQLGRGNYAPMLAGLIKASGTTVGKSGSFKDLPEAAAAVSVASSNVKPAEAATMVGQTIRALSIRGSEQSEGSDKFLRDANIAEGDNFQTRVNKIAPKIKEWEAAGKDPLEQLSQVGFGNMTDRRGIVFFSRNQDLLNKRFEQVAEARGDDGLFKTAADRGAVLNDQFLRTPVPQSRIGEAEKDEAHYEQFQEQVPLNLARQHAEADLFKQKRIDTWQTGIGDAFMDLGGLWTMMGGKPWRQRRIDEHVKEMQEAGEIDEKGSVVYPTMMRVDPPSPVRPNFPPVAIKSAAVSPPDSRGPDRTEQTSRQAGPNRSEQLLADIALSNRKLLDLQGRQRLGLVDNRRNLNVNI
jgi:hypothetical protein